jgi:hypothetical protein
MRRRLICLTIALATVACAEQPAPRTLVTLLPPAEPEAQSSDAAVEEAPNRDLPWPEPPSIFEHESDRCQGLAGNVPVHAAWVNPTMLRLELGAPPEGVAYAPSEPINLVGAQLRSKLMTPEQAVVFLDLSAFRIGVLANVPLECEGEIRRIRVLVMPDSGTLQYGGDVHVVLKDVTP